MASRAQRDVAPIDLSYTHITKGRTKLCTRVRDPVNMLPPDHLRAVDSLHAHLRAMWDGVPEGEMPPKARCDQLPRAPEDEATGRPPYAIVNFRYLHNITGLQWPAVAVMMDPMDEMLPVYMVCPMWDHVLARPADGPGVFRFDKKQSIQSFLAGPWFQDDTRTVRDTRVGLEKCLEINLDGTRRTWDKAYAVWYASHEPTKTEDEEGA